MPHGIPYGRSVAFPTTSNASAARDTHRELEEQVRGVLLEGQVADPRRR